MRCFSCLKIMKESRKCPYCNNYLCSETCLNFHFVFDHKINPTSDDNSENFFISSSNFNTNKNPVTSPYIVKGYISKRIIYDQTYSIKNFLPKNENGKPKLIGHGSFGKVYIATNKIDKKLYAIKHMDKRFIYKSLHSLNDIYNEIKIQSRINHPNIVKILFVEETQNSFYLVMEYAPNGNLFYYIRRNISLTEEKSFQFFIQIVNAIYFLHKNDFIHRDIKPENILLFDNNIVKLCDFGWCIKTEGEQRNTFCGTTEYMSPEMVNNKSYGKEIDVWSLGILLYEMVHGRSPFRPDKSKFSDKDVIQNIKLNKLEFEKMISVECKELIIHLLDPNRNRRYSVDDIFNSRFVKKFEKKKMFLNNDNLILNLNFNDIQSNYNDNNSIKDHNNNFISSSISNLPKVNKSYERFNSVKYKSSKKDFTRNKEFIKLCSIQNKIQNDEINDNGNFSKIPKNYIKQIDVPDSFVQSCDNISFENNLNSNLINNQKKPNNIYVFNSEKFLNMNQNLINNSSNNERSFGSNNELYKSHNSQENLIRLNKLNCNNNKTARNNSNNQILKYKIDNSHNNLYSSINFVIINNNAINNDNYNANDKNNAKKENNNFADICTLDTDEWNGVNNHEKQIKIFSTNLNDVKNYSNNLKNKFLKRAKSTDLKNINTNNVIIKNVNRNAIKTKNLVNNIIKQSGTRNTFPLINKVKNEKEIIKIKRYNTYQNRKDLKNSYKKNENNLLKEKAAIRMLDNNIKKPVIKNTYNLFNKTAEKPKIKNEGSGITILQRKSINHDVLIGLVTKKNYEDLLNTPKKISDEVQLKPFELIKDMNNQLRLSRDSGIKQKVAILK